MTFMTSFWHLTTALQEFTNIDVGYQISDKSLFQYPIYSNVGLCTLQSDIGRSDIRLSLILLITDTGLSAHLWL
jgi:hypothetical protein